jgi:nucleoside-diphosphate-sugar epimerase
MKRKYNLGAPKGVRGRSSDNALIQKLMGWDPDTKLKDGLKKTYDWIRKEMKF